jgi:hypothetical protein
VTSIRRNAIQSSDLHACETDIAGSVCRHVAVFQRQEDAMPVNLSSRMRSLWIQTVDRLTPLDFIQIPEQSIVIVGE